jgi:hypothetical protein
MLKFVVVDMAVGLFESGNDCFLKYFFFLEMHQNNIFFIFKKLFLILAYQNNFKI